MLQKGNKDEKNAPASLFLAQDVGHLVALGLAALVGAQLALGELEGALLAAGLRKKEEREGG